MIKKTIETFNLEGGDLKSVLEKRWVRIILAILLFIIVIIIIYKIWNYIYKKHHKEEEQCIPARGCILLSGVKNGSEPKKIGAEKMPPSINNSDYTLCSWLYVRSSNFNLNERTWKTVMYRGGNSSDKDTGSDDSDDQFSVQPGIWLNGPTNKLLLRWETLGRISNVKPCSDPASQCNTVEDIGSRQMLQDDIVQYCKCTGSDDPPVGWSDEPPNLFTR